MEENIIIYIYKITNLINNKIYIGKTENIKKRFRRHFSEAKYRKKKGMKLYYIHKAILKYGLNNFNIVQIGVANSNKEASDLEINFIKNYNSKNPEIGYNMADGGEGIVGLKRNKSTIEKHRRAILGRPLTEEHKKAISIGNMGKVMSEEAKKKISEKNSGLNNGMYGVATSKEIRAARGDKIKLSKKGRKNNLVVDEDFLNKMRQGVKNKEIVSDQIKDEIIKLYDSGTITKKQISEKYNLLENTIKSITRHWVKTKKTNSKKISNEKKEEIIFIYLRNHSRKKTAEMVNLPFNRVDAVIRFYINKIKTEPPKSKIIISDEKIILLYSEYKSIKGVGKATGLSFYAVKKRLQLLNILP